MALTLPQDFKERSNSRHFNRLKLLASLALSIAIFLVVVMRQSHQAYSADGRAVFPTLAPTPTLGPASVEWPPSAPLAEALTTPEQALAVVLEYDATWSVWEKPWDANTLQAEPERVTLEAFSSLTAESAAAGRNEGFAPEVEADAGAVWRITIRGAVFVNTLAMQNLPTSQKYDGVTYIISQRTGGLLAVITGKKLK